MVRSRLFGLFALALALAPAAWSAPAACVAGSADIETNVSALLLGTRGAVERYNENEPGKPALRVDAAVCDTATGVLAAMLNRLGMSNGRDYQITGTMSHVFLTLPREGKIIDPTFAQVFRPDSAAHDEIFAKGGFIGSREELHAFLLAHENEIYFDHFPFLKKPGYRASECEAVPGITPDELPQCRKIANGALLEEMDSFFWGTHTDPHESFVMNSAAERALRLAAQLEDPQAVREQPRLSIMKRTTDQLACPTREVTAACHDDGQSGIRAVHKSWNAIKVVPQAVLRTLPER